MFPFWSGQGPRPEIRFPPARTEQQAERLLRLKFRHVVADKLVQAEKFGGENLREFRLADPGGAEKQKAAARPARLAQAQFAAPQHRHHVRNDVRLAANFRAQGRSRWRRRSIFSGSIGVMFIPQPCQKDFFILCNDYTKPVSEGATTLRVIGGVCRRRRIKTKTLEPTLP